MVYVLLTRVRPEGDIEEFNAAAKVDRTPQGTNPDSPRDHRFWRRRKLSPARANNPQPGREPPPTQSYSSLNIILDDRLRVACVSSARATLSVLVSWSRIRLVSAIQATRTAPAASRGFTSCQANRVQRDRSSHHRAH